MTFKSFVYLSVVLTMMFLPAAHAVADGERDAAFKAAATYQPDMDLAPIETIEGIVQHAVNHPAERATAENDLVGLLESPRATFHARQFACQQLYIIGGKRCVPALAKLLRDESTMQMACYALRANPSEEAGKVLLAALDKAPDTLAPTVIHVLVQRNDSGAIPALASLVDHDNQTVALAAIGGLGHFANSDAVAALRDAAALKNKTLSAAGVRSLLACADALAAAGKTDKAVSIYRDLFTKDRPLHVRRGALLGLMRYGGKSGQRVSLTVLAKGPSQLQSVVTARAGLLTGDGVIDKLLDRLAKLDTRQQATLIEALVEAHGEKMQPRIVKLAGDDSETVRIAAFKAMGRIGNAEFVARLVKALAGTPAEKNAALAALVQLPQGRADTLLIAKAKSAPRQVQFELVDVLAARQSFDGIAQLIDAKDEDVAVAALRAYAHLADKSAVDNLFLIVMLESQSERRRAACERAIVAIARNRQNESATVNTAIGELKEATSVKVRSSLLRILGSLPDDKSFTALTAALDDPDASCRETALRQLFDWPDPRALPTLIKLTMESKDKVHRVLAMRALVRLAGHADVPADKQVEYLGIALERADQPDQLKLIISGLGNARSAEAIDLIAPFLDQPAVRAEAELATINVAARVLGSGEAVAAADKLRTTAQTEAVRKRAAALVGTWSPLFDGKSLSGWSETGDAIFKIEDGCLVGTQTSGKGGDLWHDGQFDDFELRVTYRMVWPGNSGFWFRYDGKQGYQYDVLKYKKPVAFSGSLYCHGKMFIARNLDVSIENRDDWNEARLLAVGDAFTLWLNDTKVGHTRDATYTKGCFGLQVHGGNHFKGMKIIIKQMDVRKLTPER